MAHRVQMKAARWLPVLFGVLIALVLAALPSAASAADYDPPTSGKVMQPGTGGNNGGNNGGTGGQFQTPTAGSGLEWASLTDSIMSVANGLLLPARALGVIALIGAVCMGLFGNSVFGDSFKAKLSVWSVLVGMVTLAILPDLTRFVL